MRNLKIAMIASTIATAGLAIASPAMAQQANTARPDMTRAQVEAKAAERFAKMDVNNDGVLNTADRAARRAQAFQRLDSDRNGSISQAEFDARQAARTERRGQRAEGGKRGGMRGHRMGAKTGGGRMGMARTADTNNDQAISRAEFTSAALARFDRSDADRNGTVTQAERQSQREVMRAQWQQRRAQRQAN